MTIPGSTTSAALVDARRYANRIFPVLFDQAVDESVLSHLAGLPQEVSFSDTAGPPREVGGNIVTSRRQAVLYGFAGLSTWQPWIGPREIQSLAKFSIPAAVYPLHITEELDKEAEKFAENAVKAVERIPEFINAWIKLKADYLAETIVFNAPTTLGASAVGEVRPFFSTDHPIIGHQDGGTYSNILSNPPYRQNLDEPTEWELANELEAAQQELINNRLHRGGLHNDDLPETTWVVITTDEVTRRSFSRLRRREHLALPNSGGATINEWRDTFKLLPWDSGEPSGGKFFVIRSDANGIRPSMWAEFAAPKFAFDEFRLLDEFNSPDGKVPYGMQAEGGAAPGFPQSAVMVEPRQAPPGIVGLAAPTSLTSPTVPAAAAIEELLKEVTNLVARSNPPGKPAASKAARKSSAKETGDSKE